MTASPIHSLLETDLYKFTMWQAMLHRHPQTHAEYTFVCRNTPAYPLAELAAEVSEQVRLLCAMRFTYDELGYLRSLRFLKSDFIDFLSIFQFQQRFIEIRAEGERLSIVARGPQVHVMGFEIYLLAIVNELYFRRLGQAGVLDTGRARLDAKMALVESAAAQGALDRRHPFEFFDFGIRRRYSR
ncbi:MAG TPA: nicotinate phosphoribosyltransferase, partial [Burkholderiaceae bacterium]|nr:nicotinate phosphoribosyltransferase [Burkholderiaceae bacterium]